MGSSYLRVYGPEDKLMRVVRCQVEPTDSLRDTAAE